MADFTPFSAMVGGALIGLSATVMLVLHGRVTGISGILGQSLGPQEAAEDGCFRLWFLAGLLAGGVPFALFLPEKFAMDLDRSTLALVVAGLLVGFGTRLGAGCTSGHGVCGVSRLSPRSIAATVTFIGVGAAVVYVVRTWLGGAV